MLRRLSSIAPSMLRRNFWDGVPRAAADPIMGLSAEFKADTSPDKVGLVIGAYRDGQGEPWILPSVTKAENILLEKKVDKEYLPIDGDAEFLRLAAGLIYDPEIVASKRLAICQTLSGSGSLSLAGEFMMKYHSTKSIYIPNPTWANHNQIFTHVGANVKSYRYYDPKALGLDIPGMISDLETAPDNSIFMFHAVAHNPTGFDPTQEEWAQIEQAVAAKKHLCFFDNAYQGFASDLEKDAWAVKYFVSKGHNIVHSQSFAKNMGLYGERVGTLSMLCKDEEQAADVTSQLKILIRSRYSSPPKHGALVAKTVMGDPALFSMWKGEMAVMVERIDGMRKLLRAKLEEATQTDWSHITTQIGMFSFMGLNPEECASLKRDHHIYLTKNGRISMAGVTADNVEYIANAVKQVRSK